MTVEYATNHAVSPHAMPPEYLARRVYFEALSANLVVQGIEGERIGAIIAELDSHLEASHAEPTEEFGPANELAESLLTSVGRARMAPYLIRSVAFGASLGLMSAVGTGLTLHSEASTVTLVISNVVMSVALSLGMAFLIAKSMVLRDGRHEYEFPPLRWVAIVFVAMSAATTAASPLRFEIPTVAAWVVLAVGAAATVASVIEIVRWGRVRVPGNARHLKGLAWGRLGRYAG